VRFLPSGTPLHGKTPLLLPAKKVPIHCLSHEFNLDAIGKDYGHDPPLSIHLKKSLFAFVRCLYVMSLSKKEERVWRKGNWCGSTTTLNLQLCALLGHLGQQLPAGIGFSLLTLKSTFLRNSTTVTALVNLSSRLFHREKRHSIIANNLNHLW